MVWLMSWLVSSHERGIIYVVKNENYVTEKRQKKKKTVTSYMQIISNLI